VRAGGDELLKLRKQPGSARGVNLSVSFLKNSDDHSVIGLAAVLRAMSRRDRPAETYRDWGVVSGPKMFGRDLMASAVARYRAEGAWGIPPHMIPHGTLHAASGTISQALAIHGPNLSVGGGPSACSEAIVIAASMLAENNLPGLWLVLSAFEAEKLPDNPAFAGLACEAVALALTLQAGTGPTLRIDLGSDVPTNMADFTLPDFRAAVDAERAGRWRLPLGGCVEFAGQK
jgi:hypothetical protein